LFLRYELETTEFGCNCPRPEFMAEEALVDAVEASAEAWRVIAKCDKVEESGRDGAEVEAVVGEAMGEDGYAGDGGFEGGEPLEVGAFLGGLEERSDALLAGRVELH